MITLSKPISSGQAQAYHREEFANARENYYTEGERVRGEWQGQLATRWGLQGEVQEQQFARLAEGQHPGTGEQLVRHQTAREYINANGETVRTMEHRAGWDATFSAPKSVSLTALVGGDDRVRDAHRESVRTALDEMEKYAQARMGGNVPAQTTGQWAVAKFEHDSSRPVDGYAAPQLHTHVVIFNMTETADGQTRALQPQELYRTQQYATAVYRSELAARLQEIGYEIERGAHGQPEIKGYTREYLEASSPRRQQIEEHMEKAGVRGAGAAQIAAHQTRDAKQPLSHEEVRAQHQRLAAEHGQQPQHVVEEAAQRPSVQLKPEQAGAAAHEGVSYARERGMEREAVADERTLMRDALKHTMGEARLPEVRAEFERRAEHQELIEVERRPGLAGRAFTTGEMQGYERELIERMKLGQGTREVLADGEVRQQTMEQHPHLSVSQRNAVEDVLTSRDRMMALEGVAGGGKTTSLAAVREGAERAGYRVEGLAPTSRAAQKLAEAGIETQTLQRHLARGEQPENGQKRLYVVDESSMASTKQIHTFVERLREDDRVLFVGDVRQHEAVEAGRPYAQLQEAGMRTARLDEIIRQKDPALKEAVEQLARGEVREAIGNLNSQGRVHEMGDRQERISEVAREYVRSPERTLVVSPDNASRREINDAIHRTMQSEGKVYSMQASANGFTTVSQPPVTLQVGQTATFDFELKVGSTTSTVTVNAAAPALETATAELGTVVSPKEMNDLPLNGRNFTQLLLITPGTVNLNTDQSSGGGGGWNGASIGQFSFPAVNGARNRSNMFILDGANDLNTLSGTYNYAPIVDAIQEFKSQGHNDLAEYGGAAGAMVSVVTKSGTNQYHGDLWEFLRNEQMDSRGYFEQTRNPLRQNQYGASAGGPLSIPKLYNGKNRTFFFVAWEGYRFASKAETGGLGPTAAMRNGDFSGLVDSKGNMIPIYDPATTTLSGTSYTRETSTNEYNEPNSAYCNGHVNCIPTSRFNPISALFESIIPQSSPNTVNGQNVFVPAPTDYTQDSGTARFDQNFGNDNQVMFRYSQFNLQQASATGTIGLQNVNVYGHNYIGHWTHTFSPTAFSDVYFGRNYGYTITGATHPGEDAAFISQLQQDGMSKYWMTLNNTVYAPQYTAGGYIGLSGSQLQASGLGDDWQFGGSFSKIIGRHTIQVGADFETNNFTSPIAYAGDDFEPQQTSSLGSSSSGGNSWASLLLGIPNGATYRNIDEVVHGGWINGIYIQDQFKATSRLTLNLGFRNDMVLTPIYGTGNAGNYYTGEANPITGQYILNALPPNCSATQGAPCIPTGSYTASSTPAPGGLPAHAVVSPTLRMIKNSLANWAPRLGLAYRINDKTMIRSAFSRFYDEWADITQLSQNFGGNWPAVNTIDNSNLNAAIPTVTASDPLQFGSGGAIVYPINDFSQVSQWMVDPNFTTPVFDQWNAGIERELPANITLDANYVGSNGRHEDWGPAMNVPQPGPGSQQARRPYPYMQPQWFDQSVGDSRYNALQVTVTQRATHGLTFLAAYTLSHANADGCNLGASCDEQNPYDRASSYGTSDLNQTNVFTVAFTAASPFDKSPNKFVSKVGGAWALNGIVRETSGQPYTVTAGGDPENVGGINQERMNVVGDPNAGGHTQKEWFNTSAFAVPGYTYGNEKVNSLVSQHYNDVDMSLFRQFHIGLGETRYFEFRAESFNLFNNVVFGVPDKTSTDTNYGQITSQVTGQNNQPATRQLQMSLKFYY